jgi:hypothetical protein
MSERGDGLPGLSSDFAAALAELDQAIKDEGFAEDGPLGVFAKAQKKAIGELARIVTAADIVFTKKFTEMQAFGASAERRGENELLKLRQLFEGADKVLAMAKKGAENALAVQVHTREQTKNTVASLAQQMAGDLLDQTHGWLLIKQRACYRREAWILAGFVSVFAFGILLAGYEARAWQDAPATEALSRCAASSFSVQIGTRPKPDRACPIEELTPRALTSLPDVLKGWLFQIVPEK